MATYFIYTLPFFFTIYLIFRSYYFTRSPSSKNPPPSPPKLPIIGNLHQLSSLLHRSFFSLSKRYGEDLMLLHLGSVPTLVVSSTDSAREIIQTHDLTFASKPEIQMLKTIYYDLKEIAVAPYGEYWRQAKKIMIVHYLSNKKVQTFSRVRDEEIAITIRNIEKHCTSNKVVNLGDLFMEHTNGVSCMATFGRKYHDGETGEKFKRVFKELLEVLTSFYFAETIPQLGWIDQINGANGRIENVAKFLDEFLELAVEERLAKIDSRKDDYDPGEDTELTEPFIDALLKIPKDSFSRFSFDRDCIKALIMDSYLAGTETTASVLEWVMAELLTHPNTLKKLQEEVRTIVNGKQRITDEDVEKMKYLKAVIMEATRLHPPVPVTFPRVASQDAKVMGFDIAKGTRVYINIWAIGRDPKVWENADEFLPERFSGGDSVDFVSHEFKFIPFSAGRRGCPGRGFGLAVVQSLLANLLWKFDWVLSDEVKDEFVKMNETSGLASHTKTPMLAFATPFSS